VLCPKADCCPDSSSLCINRYTQINNHHMPTDFCLLGCSHYKFKICAKVRQILGPLLCNPSNILCVCVRARAGIPHPDLVFLISAAGCYSKTVLIPSAGD
jgi:hypothetical protein